MGYRRIVLLLLYLGIIPGVLLSAIGVFLLILGEALNLLAGILVLTFTGTLVTGVILVWLFVRRERNLSELQADFVSKVSHELRTPLTSIRMFTETLKMRRGDVVTEDRCIDALDRESARLQALIDRLLDWGRMEAGRRTFEMGSHDVGEIVKEAVNTFEPTRTSRDVSISIAVPSDLPQLVCDRGAIVDALVNLLSNAYKYGGSPRKIDISAEVTDDTVRIAVRDNGVGIERREHKRIFLKFYRVDDKLTRKQDGSGLGLAIVQYVLRAHSGSVELESAPGAGSTFTLVLPIRRPVTDRLLPDGPAALAAKGGP
ncbi:MAG: HAMP domain-containing histidine kinase [Polyangiaceae bacterium]|nr:HAMP domain-containing histidine kinase [Polyangiaceae bacterium]